MVKVISISEKRRGIVEELNEDEEKGPIVKPYHCPLCLTLLRPGKYHTAMMIVSGKTIHRPICDICAKNYR